MTPKLEYALNRVNVRDYVVEIPISGDYVSYRYCPNPFEASKREARYNENGIDCFYLANSVETASHEVRFNFHEKEVYKVKAGSVFAFDAQKFATESSLMDMLTGAQTDGGYRFCQELASHLTTKEGLSGVFYPSRQMALHGKSGMCIALLPQTWQLDSGKLYIFERSTM